MKKITTTITAAAMCFVMLFSTSTVFAANNNNTEDIIVEETTAVKYSINPLSEVETVAFGLMLKEKGNVKINILNMNGDVLHTFKQSKTEGFMGQFNLKALGEKEYVFEITANGQTFKEKVSFKKQDNTELNAYISDAEASKVKLSFFEPEGSVYLKVKNTDGEVIYSNKLSEKYSYSGIVNLEELKKGSYTIELINGEKTMSKAVIVG